MTDRARSRLAALLAYCDAHPEDADPEAVAWLRAQGEAAGIVRGVTDSGCTVTAPGYCMGVSGKDAATPTERDTMTTTTNTTSIEYTDALAREWIEAAGQAADFVTIDRAEEAIAGDAEAQADVVRWEAEARTNRAEA